MIMVAAAGALAFGCAENKFTRANFDTIVEGRSSKEEVKLTLGDKYDDLGDQWTYEDESKHITAFIYFDERGMVRRKQWIDARAGTWEGSAPGIDDSPQGRKASEEKSNMTIERP